MSHPLESTLRPRIDDYSFQVISDADPRFWFRLEREAARDVITDFFLGAFPGERAASLLAQCYGLLNLSPKWTLVFRDILPGTRPPASEDAVDDARALYVKAGTDLLIAMGARRVVARLTESNDKYHLILVAE